MHQQEGWKVPPRLFFTLVAGALSWEVGDVGVNHFGLRRTQNLVFHFLGEHSIYQASKQNVGIAINAARPCTS